MNLEKTQKGYEYRTAALGLSIDVEVVYDKGGDNWFTGDPTSRGIWAVICPVQREEWRGHVVTRFTLMTGGKVLLKPLSRKSDKALAEVAAVIDPVVPEAALAFTQSAHAAFAMLQVAMEESGYATL